MNFYDDAYGEHPLLAGGVEDPADLPIDLPDLEFEDSQDAPDPWLDDDESWWDETDYGTDEFGIQRDYGHMGD